MTIICVWKWPIVMGNKVSDQPLYNPYALKEKSLKNFANQVDDCDYDECDLVDIVFHRSRKIQENPYSRYSKKSYYNHFIGAITLLEEQYNIHNNPRTKQPWIILVSQVQLNLGFCQKSVWLTFLTSYKAFQDSLTKIIIFVNDTRIYLLNLSI